MTSVARFYEGLADITVEEWLLFYQLCEVSFRSNQSSVNYRMLNAMEDNGRFIV